MNKLEEALSLREQKKLDESNSIMLELVEEHPDNPEINYQCAWSYDVLGEEAKAVPYYERAIDLGLSGEDLEGAFLGLGSTYRSLGHYQSSKQVFEKGIKLFPDNQALKVFLSMTLYNLNQHNQAMEILLKCVVETTSDINIKAYSKAIKFYSDKLDKVW